MSDEYEYSYFHMYVTLPDEDNPMTKDSVKKLVDRFLGWELPRDFNPDGGISFTPPSRPNYPWPVGTNLLDADQATKLVEYLLVADTKDTKDTKDSGMSVLAWQIYDEMQGYSDSTDEPISRVNLAKILAPYVNQRIAEAVAKERERIHTADREVLDFVLARLDENSEVVIEAWELLDAMGRDINDYDGDGTELSIYHDIIEEFAKALESLQIIYDGETGEYTSKRIAEEVAKERERVLNFFYQQRIEERRVIRNASEEDANEARVRLKLTDEFIKFIRSI